MHALDAATRHCPSQLDPVIALVLSFNTPRQSRVGCDSTPSFRQTPLFSMHMHRYLSCVFRQKHLLNHSNIDAAALVHQDGERNTG